MIGTGCTNEELFRRWTRRSRQSGPVDSHESLNQGFVESGSRSRGHGEAVGKSGWLPTRPWKWHQTGKQWGVRMELSWHCFMFSFSGFRNSTRNASAVFGSGSLQLGLSRHIFAWRRQVVYWTSSFVWLFRFEPFFRNCISNLFNFFGSF